MRPDPVVVAELRSLFLAGATPSRLIRQIVASHAGVTNLYSLVQWYFREAFSIPLLRITPDFMLQEPQGLALAMLNVRVVHQMILSRPTWDDSRRAEGDEPSWLDTLTAADESDHLKEINPEGVPELAGSWGRLDEDAQRYLLRVMGNARTLAEQVTVLATLAEQLQQRVNALEEAEARKASGLA